MSPVTHFLTGWVLANSVRLDRRGMAAVTVAAVIPDIDGIGIVAEVLTRHSSHPLLWFSEYHHALHSLAFAVVVAMRDLRADPTLADSRTGTRRIPPSPAGGFGRLTRAGRFHLASPIPATVHEPLDLELERSMAAQCVAESRTDHPSAWRSRSG